MGTVQLQRGGQLAPYSFPDTWSTRQAATGIASVVGKPQGVEWWHGDWRLFYNPSAPGLLSPTGTAPKMADPEAPFSLVAGCVVVLGWITEAEFWN